MLRPAAQPAAQAWDVRLTGPAEAVYRDLVRLAGDAEERGDLTSSHCTTLRMVDEVLDRVILQNPIDRRHALAGDLSNIYRYRKGRMRIYWIASSQLRQVAVLFISDSPRKEGDAHDPYRVFGRMVMSGQFNEFFKQLGVKVRDGVGEHYDTHQPPPRAPAPRVDSPRRAVYHPPEFRQPGRTLPAERCPSG